MIQQGLVQALSTAVAAAAPELGLPADGLPLPELQRPRQKEHGDWATNVALVIAPRAGRNPREVAEALVAHFPPTDLVDAVEVAGPGFVNIRLHHRWLYEVLRAVLQEGDAYGTRAEPRGVRANVEFVSANPTGPLHVGHARNTVLGDGLANLLAADGYGVEREYYWNDTGTQMELLGESIEARYLVRFGVPAEVPENGYQGDYVDVVAAQIADDVGDVWVAEEPAKRRAFFEEEGRARMVAWVRSTLDRFGVHFDTWFSEATLQEDGAIEAAVELLRAAGHAYEADGAVWFRATDFGDDKDRVLIRGNGQPTYFAKDVAYMRNKFARGFDLLVYVWGSDHHGDLKRMRGVAQAMGHEPGALEFVLYQMVSLSRGREPVRMSKRAGDLVTLDELLDEVGVDAARYTLLARSADSPIDFDIVEVARQSMDNPVYYVQYAHARIASLLRVAGERGESPPPWGEVSFEELTEEAELDLLRKLSELPEAVELSADGLAPHRLARYTEELAALFHRFYTECRVISDDASRTHARLWLSAGTKQVLGSALRWLGVSAPESMERLWDDEEE